MQAGKKLDALIAEKFFGLHLKDRLTEKEIPITSLQALEHVDLWSNIPNYSTDISAAWLLVENLRSWADGLAHPKSLFFYDSIIDDEDEDSIARGKFWTFCIEQEFLGDQIPTIHVESSTFPHVVCLAAIKTLRYPIQLCGPTAPKS